MKTSELWDAKVSVWDRQTNTSMMKPMLLGDKMTVFSISVIASPFILPILFVRQMNYLDIYLRGLKPSDYDYDYKKKHTIDYIF